MLIQCFYRPNAFPITQEHLITNKSQTLGDFTFWISLSLRPNFGVRPNLIKKVK